MRPPPGWGGRGPWLVATDHGRAARWSLPV